MMRLAVFSCALVAVVFAGEWSAGQTPLKRSSGDDSSPARSAAAFSNVPPAEASSYPAPRRGGEQARSSGRAIALDVTIAEFADAAKSAATLPLESGQKTLERIRELESQGKVALVTRVRLTTVDARPAMLQIGEQASMAAARRFGGGRPAREGGGFEPAATSYVRQNVGLIIGATARVQADGSLTVDLDLEKSQISARPQRGDPAEGIPAGVATMKTQSTVHIPAGQTVIVGGTQMASPSESGQTIVLVSGQVSAGAAGKDAAGDPASAHEEPATKIFHLRHASAGAAAKLVHNLYRSPTLICSADERINAVIARGSPKELAEIEAVLERLDAAGK